MSEILFYSEHALIGLNQDQLLEGRNNKGNLIGRYTEHTQAASLDPTNLPKQKKWFGDPYNFEWTGEFFRAFQVKQDGTGVEITSQVSYLDSIKRLGSRNRAQDKLFGLTDEHKAKFNKEVLIPGINRRVKQV